MNKSLEERFALYVDPGADDECWEWMGATCKATKRHLPYGHIRVKEGSKWVTAPAHQVAFFLASGYWTSYVLHECDNPSCVNPNHLKAGTQRENMEDASRRGRLNFARHNEGGRIGAKRPPISIEEVRTIRDRYTQGETQRAIAESFGITQGGVSSIVRGRTRSKAA